MAKLTKISTCLVEVGLTALLSFVPLSMAHAVTLSQKLPRLMTIDPRIRGAQHDLMGAKYDIHAAVADYLPQVTLTGYAGTQKTYKETSTNVNAGVNEEKGEIDQLIFDYGKTIAAIRSAGDKYKKANVELDGVRQDVMLDGATAYVKLVSAYRTLVYAEKYKDNVAKQVQTEISRKKKGAGYQTDVLEARAQLQGAQARQVQAEGALINAQNVYQREFQETNAQMKGDTAMLAEYIVPEIPTKLLPSHVEEAVMIAQAHDTDIVELEYDVKVARQQIKQDAAAFGPKIDASAAAKYDYNVEGTLGKKEDYTAKINVSYPIFTSGADYATLKSSEEALASSQESLDDKRLEVDEEIRNDWQSWNTADKNASYLAKQVETLSRFVTLAMKERQMGRKTLLEVLVADSNYINAISDYFQAKVTLSVAAYTLLRHMGELSLDAFDLPAMKLSLADGTKLPDSYGSVSTLPSGKVTRPSAQRKANARQQRRRPQAARVAPAAPAKAPASAGGAMTPPQTQSQPPK